ncbi:hypothetical protein ABZ510_20770, partial [Nocardia rhamnosiphila]
MSSHLPLTRRVLRAYFGHRTPQIVFPGSPGPGEPTGHPGIRASGHPGIRASGHPGIRASGHPGIRASG